MQPSITWSSSVSLFVTEMMAIIHFLKCTVPFSFAVQLLSLAVTHCQSLSLFVTHFHSLSLVVTHCHSLQFVVTRFTTRCHSLSFIVTRCTTRCHSLSLVVTRCTTRLSFYKRSKIFCTSETALCFLFLFVFFIVILFIIQKLIFWVKMWSFYTF